MGFKKITVTVPDFLYEQANELINHGIFANFADLVREGIRNELKEEAQLIEKCDWKSQLEELQTMMKKSRFAKMSEEQIVEELRKARDQLWEKKYKKLYVKALKGE